jgi:uncharacterized protein YndB with AHSA1/START domain
MTDFVYTTYIKSTPEKIWQAITTPEFTKQYWGNTNVSDWKKGSPWHHVDRNDNKTPLVVGEVIESVPPKRLVISWVDPANTADVSRVTFEIEAVKDMVRLNVVHGDFKPGSIMPGKISQGWPLVLSNLKSFLETGKAFDIFAIKGDCGQPKAS